jgi:hypothetical protein
VLHDFRDAVPARKDILAGTYSLDVVILSIGSAENGYLYGWIFTT